MDWLSFIASIIRSLAWPMVVALVVIVFRTTLNRTLLSLNQLNYKGFDAKFGEQVARAKGEFDSDSHKPKTKEDIEGATENRQYFQILAETSPRAALLEAWFPFEVAISRIALKLGISQRDRPTQMPDIIDGLKRQGILTDEEARAVSRLRAIRNEAAHSPVTDLSPENVAEYASLLHEIKEAMESKEKEKKLDL